jgi:hypothetical protein
MSTLTIARARTTQALVRIVVKIHTAVGVARMEEQVVLVYQEIRVLLLLAQVLVEHGNTILAHHWLVAIHLVLVVLASAVNANALPNGQDLLAILWLDVTVSQAPTWLLIFVVSVEEMERHAWVATDNLSARHMINVVCAVEMEQNASTFVLTKIAFPVLDPMSSAIGATLDPVEMLEPAIRLDSKTVQELQKPTIILVVAKEPLFLLSLWWLEPFQERLLLPSL